MAQALPTAKQINDFLRESGKAVHAGMIAKHFDLERRSFHLFGALLSDLAARREILSAGGDRYRAVQEKPEGRCWSGTLTVTQRGFGFVAAPQHVDVFVPAEALGGALHGDTVDVEVTRTTSRGAEGVVVSIKKRRNHRIAGLLHVRKNSAWLEPDDTRVRGPLTLVGDLLGAKDGQAAVAEIVRFPEDARENPEAKLIAVLGTPGEVHVEVAKIKMREQIEEQHPEAAIIEAEKVAALSRRLPLGTRQDLREIPFLTIDPSDARDHDDAVWATRTEAGFRVYIAIADVSHYVQDGTALDAEANKRGCTIYLPDRAIPMLPGVLAADLCSLLPEKERYCLCVIAELDEQCNTATFEVVEGLMRAAAMISYDSAARTLGFSENPPLSVAAEAFKKDLKCLAQVSAKLRRQRMRRGALDLDLPEAKLELGADGAPEGVHKRTHDPGIKKAYQLIEELMLLANELVAQWLTEREAPAIYRVHGRPDDEKIARLAAAAELLGAPFNPEEMSSPKAVSNWMQRIESHPRRSVLENLLLRSLKQATYDVVNIGHFGLASEAYLHFTSPIRRYPDLLVHRSVKQILSGARIDKSAAAVEALTAAASNSSTRERAAMLVEREIMDLYRALYMRDRVGEILEGTVTSLVGSGIFVQVEEPFIDVMIRFESLGAERFELAEDELSLVAPRSGDRILLGDKLAIEIEEVSLLRRMIYGKRLAFISTPDDDYSRAPRSLPSRSKPRPPGGAEFNKGGAPFKGGAGFKGDAPFKGRAAPARGVRAEAPAPGRPPARGKAGAAPGVKGKAPKRGVKTTTKGAARPGKATTSAGGARRAARGSKKRR